MAESPTSSNAGSDALEGYRQAIELSAAAEAGRLIRRAEEQEESREADIAHFDALLDELVATVTEDFREKFKEAASAGHRSAELYAFDGGDKFGDSDHSLLFLIKGPRRQGDAFFLNLGLLPFTTRAYLAVRPFKIDLAYDPEANENTVLLKWP